MTMMRLFECFQFLNAMIPQEVPFKPKIVERLDPLLFSSDRLCRIRLPTSCSHVSTKCSEILIYRYSIESIQRGRCSMRWSNHDTSRWFRRFHSNPRSSSALILSSVQIDRVEAGFRRAALVYLQNAASSLSKVFVTRRWPCNSFNAFNCSMRCSTLFFCPHSNPARPVRWS